MPPNRPSGPLRIASAQFPVSGNIAENLKFIQKLIDRAVKKEAQVILFPEGALPGYGPKHFDSFEGYAWGDLEAHTQNICEAALARNIWVVLGSMRRGSDELPKNCLHVISNEGKIVGTYDKRRLYHREKEYYASGSEPLVVEIGGYKCGFLICYDNCYPELYEEYRSLGVGLLFHSFFNAGNSEETAIKDLCTANLITRAADHQMWIAASNSSTRYSPLASCIVRPDGSMKCAKRHVTSLVIDEYPIAELGWTYDNRIK